MELFSTYANDRYIFFQDIICSFLLHQFLSEIIRLEQSFTQTSVVFPLKETTVELFSTDEENRSFEFIVLFLGFLTHSSAYKNINMEQSYSINIGENAVCLEIRSFYKSQGNGQL